MKIPWGKELVLVGGGHTHALFLKKWGMNPWPGVRVTLISPVAHTPYSGMLPGLVSGLYSFDEAHIDLYRLSEYAQVQFILDEAVGLDLQGRKVFCRHHPPLSYDVLSLNLGSHPGRRGIEGGDQFGHPIKPVSSFLHRWEDIKKEKNPRICLVGGGAGGVELSLNMESGLQGKGELHLFQQGPDLLPTHPPSVRRTFTRLLGERGIHLHLGHPVKKVTREKVICSQGDYFYDHLFWVTGAEAPAWPGAAGLAVDERNFIQIRETLQTVSHPEVFAVGDVSSLADYPREKAGVYAVRQAGPLFENLRRFLQQPSRPLRSYIPQKKVLTIIGTGRQKAVAAKGFFSWYSGGAFKVKDRIDRQFMKKFEELRPRSSSDSMGGPKGAMEGMRCLGCAAKVGSPILRRALARLERDQDQNQERPDGLILGLADRDDAAILSLDQSAFSGRHLVQTTDYFPSPLRDPYLLGRIAVNHALSDLWAMGARPHSALSLILVPYAMEKIMEESLFLVLKGVKDGLREHGALLIGGHTAEAPGEDLAVGLTCNGVVSPNRILKKGGMREGEAVVLTKALGTGTLLAAHRQLLAKGRWVEGAVNSMLLANEKAAQALLLHQASSCTDVTGFGFLGHLMEMVEASSPSSHQVELFLSHFPVLQGAGETLGMGVLSSLHEQNRQSQFSLANGHLFSGHPLFPLLFDPQTSGGLVATVPWENVSGLIKDLRERGYPQAAVVGRIGPPLSSLSPERRKQPITLKED